MAGTDLPSIPVSLNRWCTYCHSSKNVVKITMPYAAKLLFQELLAMNVVPRLRFEDAV